MKRNVFVELNSNFAHSNMHKLELNGEKREKIWIKEGKKRVGERSNPGYMLHVRRIANEKEREIS